MSEYTPGPWASAPCGSGGRILIRGTRQSHLQILPDADAYLIAAAPDLYEAALAALQAIESLQTFETEANKLRAAIAKARP